MTGMTRGRSMLWLLLAFGLALALRLLVWHWHKFYPLGGDEQEYLQQALTLLREHRYTELRLMRPPLYGLFLAGSIHLFDSLLQRLRLVQVVISAATVVPVWLLTAELARWYPGMRERGRAAAPVLAALLCALSYTLAFYANELLTETLFLFGLSLVLWLLLRAGAPGTQRPYSAAAAGVALGLLCLTRSVAVVLLPLGVLWLLAAHWRQGTGDRGQGTGDRGQGIGDRLARFGLPLLFLACAALVILPWTARNYATYGAVILIDTTGAENLWLDNDPAGREAVKAQLYAMGEDRAARQQVAAARGLAAITGDPLRFLQKAWGELLAFFALEYTDDMRARPVIWVPPAEVAARLLLGDGLWLLLLLGGMVGLCIVPRGEGQEARRSVDPRWLLVAWALYTLLTALVFHVELRYRLPLYPVLLPYAAFALASVLGGWRRTPGKRPSALAAALVVLILGLMLLHRPYPVLAWHLTWKHVYLNHAGRYLDEGRTTLAARAARAALAHDPDSVLARVAWARAEMLAGDALEAEERLRETIALESAHPLPHLLLGDLLRQQGHTAAARHELAYETASLQDLQHWSWERFTTPPPVLLDVGGGLDLGWIAGFHAAEARNGTDWRWTTRRAKLRLGLPLADSTSRQQNWLRLRLAAGRPAEAPPPSVEVRLLPDSPGQAGHMLGTLQVGRGWQDYLLPLPPAASGRRELVIELRSETFSPRAYDPASADGRTLGIMVERAQVDLLAP